MDFLKKHYEKILLGVVLIGGMIGVGLLPVMIGNERKGLEEKAQTIRSRKAEPLEPLNLSKELALMKRAEKPVDLDFATTNKLFNPVQWQKATDGRLIKVIKGSVGIEAVTVTNISDLYLTITLDSVTTNESGIRYVIYVERQAAAKAAQRLRKQYLTTLGVKNEAFIIREVKGQPEAPTEVVLELNDTGERVSIARDKPFKRVDGYMADLKYDPENKKWLNQRVGSAIIVAGESYNIVAISKNEVVFSAKSNNKKTPISFNPGP